VSGLIFSDSTEKYSGKKGQVSSTVEEQTEMYYTDAARVK